MLEKVQNHLAALRQREADLKKELARVEAQIDVLEHLTAPSCNTTACEEPVVFQSPLPVQGSPPSQTPLPQAPSPQVPPTTHPDATEVRDRMKTVLQSCTTAAKSLDQLELQDCVMSLQKGKYCPIPEECRGIIEQIIAAVLVCGDPFREVKTGKKAGNVYYRK